MNRLWAPIDTAPQGEWLLIDRGRGGLIEACYTNDEDGGIGWIDSYGNQVYGAEQWLSLEALPDPERDRIPGPVPESMTEGE